MVSFFPSCLAFLTMSLLRNALWFGRTTEAIKINCFDFTKFFRSGWVRASLFRINSLDCNHSFYWIQTRQLDSVSKLRELSGNKVNLQPDNASSTHCLGAVELKLLLKLRTVWMRQIFCLAN